VLVREDEGWELPGAPVAGDRGETPRDTALRVVRERLRGEPRMGRLLAVDWRPGGLSGCAGARFPSEVLYVYDGGVLDEGEAAAAAAPTTARAAGTPFAWRTVPPPESAGPPAGPASAALIRACLAARGRGTGAVELVAGRPMED
jgi:hypothetical protein